MAKKMNILMVAAENAAIEGGKVGGIGDVVRDIPPALATARDCKVQVVMPGYQAFSRRPSSKKVAEVEVEFGYQTETLEIYKLQSQNPHKSVTQWALEHPLFGAGGVGAIYCNDPDHRPFATDASKFALLCVGVAEAIKQGVFKKLDVLHLHDWHAALLAVLRAYDPRYMALQKLRCVFTVHNLALQGVRPLADDVSSLGAWFPKLKYDAKQIADPRAGNCINPMRAGINLSDKVHAVSPTYAQEIVEASDFSRGYFGGEGLEQDLKQAAKEQRLHGILNGCEYPSDTQKPQTTRQSMLEMFEKELIAWLGNNATADSAHIIALHRLRELINSDDKLEDRLLITSVGRITDQKVLLLKQTLASGKSGLQELLDKLGDSGLFILLGSGDPNFEQFLNHTASRNENFIFLKGYSERNSDMLYESGDLFLMPSSFEPCGISQMIAMRAAQPCLVHAIGGLKDTVVDGKTGFTFSGDSMQQQSENMVKRFAQVLKTTKQKKWQTICNNAAKQRFLWSDVAEQYFKLLYS